MGLIDEWQSAINYYSPLPQTSAAGLMPENLNTTPQRANLQRGVVSELGQQRAKPATLAGASGGCFIPGRLRLRSAGYALNSSQI